MKRFFFQCLFLCIYIHSGYAQEFFANVTVNSQKEQSTNKNVYRSLEKSVRNFINNTKWTAIKTSPQERIDINIYIAILGRPSTNSFSASLQIQSRRPVFGSDYYSPIVNLKDNDFSFEYIEFQPIIYNPTKVDNNLVAVLSYYMYFLLGMDADTFSYKGGTSFFKKASAIVSQAESKGYLGWSQFDGQKNRNSLIRDALSSDFLFCVDSCLSIITEA